jgi:hypothetical protein
MVRVIRHISPGRIRHLNKTNSKKASKREMIIPF